MIDSTVCKFKCHAVKLQEHGQTVTLGAEYDSSLDEDRRFASATPSGQMEAYISNPAVAGFFVPGKKYLVTVTPVD